VVSKKPRADVAKLPRNVKEEKKELDSFMTVYSEIHRPSYSSLDKYKESGVMDVEYAGPMLDAGGFANMNRRYIFGLDERGINVRPQILPSIPDIDFEIGKKIGALTQRKVGRGCPKIYGMTAPSGAGWSGPKIFYTMMETHTLHPDYVDRCSMADEIWLPSQWNVDIFKKAGIKIPIYKMPLGVDVDKYKPGLNPLEMSENLGGDFVFLSLFGWSYRKGYDVLLKAFLSEFTRDDDVTLLISSRYFGSTEEVKKKKIRSDVEAIKASIDNPKMPRVVLFGDVMPDAMLPRLYNSADCFVLISRGEGWGLPGCEAGACEIPVISSNYSGHTEFLNDSNSYLVDVDKYVVSDSRLSWISHFYEGQKFPMFGDAAVEQTRHHMRYVYENKKEAQKKANKLRKDLVKNYTWNKCVDRVESRLTEIYEELTNE